VSVRDYNAELEAWNGERIAAGKTSPGQPKLIALLKTIQKDGWQN
jgi:hypothetical protein